MRILNPPFLRLAVLALALALGAGSACAEGLESLLAQVPAAPADEPLAAPAEPGALGRVKETAVDVAERARSALRNYTLAVGLSVKQAGLHVEQGGPKDDSPVILPQGPTGTNWLSGERAGQTQSLWASLTSPVTFFEGSDRFGWGYILGYSRIVFDKYVTGSPYAVTNTSGSLVGTFLYAIPTLITTNAPGGRHDRLSIRGNMGAGLVLNSFEGTIKIRRATVFTGSYDNDTYRGTGALNISPAVLVDVQALIYERLVVSVSQLFLFGGRFLYTEYGYNAGVAFQF